MDGTPEGMSAETAAVLSTSASRGCHCLELKLQLPSLPQMHCQRLTLWQACMSHLPACMSMLQMLRSEDPGVHYEAVGVLGNLVHSSQDIKQQVLQVSLHL